MSGPQDDPLLEFGNERPDGFYQESGDTRAVPPPVHNEIDGLVDAISSGGRPRVASESAIVAEANDSPSADVVITPLALAQSRPSVVHSAAFRYTACAVIAFAFGTALAWSVLRRFDPPAAPIVSQPAAIEAPGTATTASAPVIPPQRPAAVSEPAAIERAPVGVTSERAAADRPVRRDTATESASSSVTAPRAVSSPRVVALPAAPPRLNDAPNASVDLGAVASSAPATVIAPPPPAPALAPASAAVSPIAIEQNAVLETLREYARAYKALDVQATAAVWPSVDRRALTRAFSTLKSHQLELEDCRVTIADASATSHCRGAVEYVRKIGSSTPRTGYQDLTFKMRKLGSEWFIDAVSASELSTRN